MWRCSLIWAGSLIFKNQCFSQKGENWPTPVEMLQNKSYVGLHCPAREQLVAVSAVVSIE
ncbi:unnamed protein product, partial [Sphagnum compactum]